MDKLLYYMLSNELEDQEMENLAFYVLLTFQMFSTRATSDLCINKPRDSNCQCHIVMMDSMIDIWHISY